MSIPIVIFHVGYRDYLELALKAAKKYNNDVVLIGDEANEKIWCDHFNVKDFNIFYEKSFPNIYNHLSDNSVEFEMLCFQRFFVIQEWMKKNEIHKIFMLDSDVLLFSELSKSIYSRFLQQQDCIAALSIPKVQEPYKWAVFCHTSYWTYDGIKSFTDFCISTYKSNLELLQKKYEWHLSNQIVGGICDMTLLYLWSKEQKKIFNLAKVYENTTIDTLITSSANWDVDEYDLNFLGIKHIKFQNGIPYSFNNKLGKDVAFLSIHCQGSAKKYMRFFANDHLRNFYQLAPFWHLVRPQRVRNKVKKMLNKI
ncbi:hypothetical protein [Coleofasciculus sp. G2-EDA-02]|uniref:hypothetical protein n=1 Tax=Coleofasciculus sp. G2-EDA-02 TaxID=3069529 RepID=UPI003302E5CB